MQNNSCEMHVKKKNEFLILACFQMSSLKYQIAAIMKSYQKSFKSNFQKASQIILSPSQKKIRNFHIYLFRFAANEMVQP